MSKHVKIPDLSALVFDASQHPGIDTPPGDFWLFGYGSLMWHPEFEYARCETARLYGYHRRLCLWSIAYRGTPERPGLVMGLDSGGSCVGRAFLISADSAPSIIANLNEREMITGAYRSIYKSAYLQSGEQIEAVTLIARRDHPQYVPPIHLKATIEIVKNATGARGSNREYVLNTMAHLHQLDIDDPVLNAIARKL